MMKYTPDEAKRFKSLLQAFESYIGDHPYFDIFHSAKHGYLYIQYESDEVMGEFILSSDDLFERLLNELSGDIRDLFLCGQHKTIDLYPAEIEATRNRLHPYLTNLPSNLQEYYKAKAEEYFLHCNDGWKEIAPQNFLDLLFTQ